jgi:hypothetical protein
MKRYIGLIIITIILVMLILKFNDKKEHYIVDPTMDVDKLSQTVRQYFNNRENREIETINARKDVELLNKSLSKWLVEFRYPVGSFYVQYGDINENYDAQSERLFPVDKSPEQMFGGKWTEQWPNEGSFFRTGGTLSQQNRILGLQQWAVKRMYGWTSWVQANRDNHRGSIGGVFSNIDLTRGGTDSNRGGDNGGEIKFNSGLQSIPSNFETRVKNRLIKVWRRVG